MPENILPVLSVHFEQGVNIPLLFLVIHVPGPNGNSFPRLKIPHLSSEEPKARRSWGGPRQGVLGLGSERTHAVAAAAGLPPAAGGDQLRRVPLSSPRTPSSSSVSGNREHVEEEAEGERRDETHSHSPDQGTAQRLEIFGIFV